MVGAMVVLCLGALVVIGCAVVVAALELSALSGDLAATWSLIAFIAGMIGGITYGIRYWYYHYWGDGNTCCGKCNTRSWHDWHTC